MQSAAYNVSYNYAWWLTRFLTASVKFRGSSRTQNADSFYLIVLNMHDPKHKFLKQISVVP